jgi:hypothetical protein
MHLVGGIVLPKGGRRGQSAGRCRKLIAFAWRWGSSSSFSPTGIPKLTSNDSRVVTTESGGHQARPPLRGSLAGLEGAGSIPARAKRTVILPSPLESLYVRLHSLAKQIRATYRTAHWAEEMLLAMRAGYSLTPEARRIING